MKIFHTLTFKKGKTNNKKRTIKRALYFYELPFQNSIPNSKILALRKRSSHSQRHWRGQFPFSPSDSATCIPGPKNIVKNILIFFNSPLVEFSLKFKPS
jgi:hypothetical protein